MAQIPIAALVAQPRECGLGCLGRGLTIGPYCGARSRRRAARIHRRQRAIAGALAHSRYPRADHIRLWFLHYLCMS